MTDLFQYLRERPYPGRGILLGATPAGKSLIAYFIMGRSENSRNRIFIEEKDGIRTEAHDPSKRVDPSLIIYHPVRRFGDSMIVTNGDQTDTVRDYLSAGRDFHGALMTREFEPDAPNYTPRISGLLRGDGSYTLSILKSADGDPAVCQRFFYFDSGYDAHAVIRKTAGANSPPEPAQPVDLRAAQFHSGEKKETPMPE